MRDTPRTEVYVLDPLPQVVSADWARQLERELNAAKARVAELEAENKTLRSRVAELEEQNSQLQSELDHAKARAKELQAETLRLEDLAKNRGKLMTEAVDQSRELEARCRRLEEAAHEVYLDSIASDHPLSTNETRNMHALRDVLEAKP